MKRIAVVILVAGLALTACTKTKVVDLPALSESPVIASPTPSATAGGCAHAAGESTVTFDGRNVVIALPKPSAKPRGVVVALHGYNGEAQDFATYTGLDKQAPAAGFVALFPQGAITSAGEPGWNYVPKASIGEDDVAYIDAMLAHYKASLCLDLSDLIVTGWSDGADMSVTYACHGKIKPAGILMVAAATGATAGCRAGAVAYVHGTADPIEPYKGGAIDDRQGYGDIRSLSAEAMTQSWVSILHCQALKDLGDSPESHVDTSVAAKCDGGGYVDLFTIEGGGHPWPSSTYDVDSAFGPTNHTFMTTKTVISMLRGVVPKPAVD